MRADELYKFSDRTLKSVRDTLHHRLLNFRLGYNKGMPRRKWSAMGQRRSGIMVNLMDKKLKLGTDYRLMQWSNIIVILHSIHSNDGNPTSANIQQALQQGLSKKYSTYFKSHLRSGFHDATYRSNDNTKTTLRNNEKILAQFKTQNVLTNLKEVHEAFKEDHALNKKDAVTTQNDHLDKWAESFASMAWSTDTADIKAMMTTILCAFRGQPFFAPSGSVPMPTLALTGILATVGGRAEEKKETPSHTKREQADMVTEEHREEKEYLDKKERMDRAMKEAQLTKPVIKKVAAEIVSEVEVHIKEIEAQESLPIIVSHMLYSIKINTLFNLAYFIARRLSGLDYNNEALPYARVLTTLFEYLKNKHPNNASRMIEADKMTPMCPPFTMKSLEV
ncbi:hypothetical protein Tco_1011244 [Tanacetum coccineum]